MTTLFDIPATLAQQATRPGVIKVASEAIPDSPADRLVLSITAAGLCVLVVWILRRLVHGRKLLLRAAPGRPNHLGWLHVGLIVVWTVGGRALALVGETPRQAPEVTAGGVVAMYVVTLGVFALALAAAHVGFRHGISRGLGLTLRRWFVDSTRGVVGVLAVYPVCVSLFMLSERIVPQSLQAPHELLEFLAGDVTAAQKLLIIGLAFGLVPIVEEVLYRGLMQTALRRVLGGPWRAIIVTSVLFAAAHLTLMRDPVGVVGVQALPPLFALAVVLGYNYERTGRLWPSIVIHMLFNGINLASALLEAA